MAEENTLYIHMSGGVVTSISAKNPDEFKGKKVVVVRNQSKPIEAGVEYHPDNTSYPITPVTLQPMSILKLAGAYLGRDKTHV
jgi:hypothetical protein